MKLDIFLKTYPRLYHMAEQDTWPSIRAHGLLSSSAALDLHGFSGLARASLESHHRPAKHLLNTNGAPPIVLRDQNPMSDKRLLMCLETGTTPSQWYRLLNSKVFFWVAEERLMGLLNARSYRELEHDVLILDSRSFIHAYIDRIKLCHINSGNTFPYPQPRSPATFQAIADYPSKIRGGPLKKVVELVVEYSVPDVEKFVLQVKRMKGNTNLGVLFKR